MSHDDHSTSSASAFLSFVSEAKSSFLSAVSSLFCWSWSVTSTCSSPLLLYTSTSPTRLPDKMICEDGPGGPKRTMVFGVWISAPLLSLSKWVTKGLRLSSNRSQISILPSLVTEANLEEVYGDHSMSLTHVNVDVN